MGAGVLTQLRLTYYNAMDSGPPESSVHGSFQVRTPEQKLPSRPLGDHPEPGYVTLNITTGKRVLHAGILGVVCGLLQGAPVWAVGRAPVAPALHVMQSLDKVLPPNLHAPESLF